MGFRKNHLQKFLRTHIGQILLRFLEFFGPKTFGVFRDNDQVAARRQDTKGQAHPFDSLVVRLIQRVAGTACQYRAKLRAFHPHLGERSNEIDSLGMTGDDRAVGCKAKPPLIVDDYVEAEDWVLSRVEELDNLKLVSA
jgi:hypothetical protein